MRAVNLCVPMQCITALTNRPTRRSCHLLRLRTPHLINYPDYQCRCVSCIPSAMSSHAVRKVFLVFLAALVLLCAIFLQWSDFSWLLFSEIKDGSVWPVSNGVGDILIKEFGHVSFLRDGAVVLNGTLGLNPEAPHQRCPHSDSHVCINWPSGQKLRVTRSVKDGVICHNINWHDVNKQSELQDCYDMGDNAHWYGLGEVYQLRWPIERLNIPTAPFLSGDMCINEEARKQFGSVIEPYWLSSKGVAIFVDKSIPLHVSIQDSSLCLRSSYKDSKYENIDDYTELKYTVCSGENVRDVHDYIRTKNFPVPSGIPDERMFVSPIWSTWARYKIFVNESSVLEFAKEIRKYKFKDSQIEIDDGYQVAHGDFDFDPNKFPNAKGLIKTLHDLGFRVTSWVHLFANRDSKAFVEGSEKGYFVKDYEGKTSLTDWWNGQGALLDVTNPDAANWYIQNLKRIQEDYGIDSFKFDAGEVRYLKQGYKTHSKLVNPGDFTTFYVNSVSKFGPQIEVRSAFNNQNISTFVRIMDKDSVWGWENGLNTLIPTTLTLGLLGYPFVLPDMIGGNTYNGTNFHALVLPDRELYIRWLQLTAFLPSMQFSIAPWQYDDDVVQISRKWTSFHESVVAPKMIEIAKRDTLTRGDPIVRPLWWVAPTDENALFVDSEFLIGDDILVAPVLDKGARARDVYLPEGLWLNNLSNQELSGPKWHFGIEVALEDIVYFTRVK